MDSRAVSTTTLTPPKTYTAKPSWRRPEALGTNSSSCALANSSIISFRDIEDSSMG